MDISTLWEGLNTLQKIFWIIALPSTLVFVIQLVMMFVGGGADMNSDFDSNFDSNFDGDFDGDHGAGVHIFSVKSVVSFLMFFGWSGLAAQQNGLLGIASLGVSITVGLTMMFLTAWIFFLFLKLQENNTTKLEDAIGNSAEVYLTIPAKKIGLGKIEIMLNGALRNVDATTEDIEDIKTGSFVEVLGVINDVFLVKRKR